MVSVSEEEEGRGRTDDDLSESLYLQSPERAQSEMGELELGGAVGEVDEYLLVVLLLETFPFHRRFSPERLSHHELSALPLPDHLAHRLRARLSHFPREYG